MSAAEQIPEAPEQTVLAIIPENKISVILAADKEGDDILGLQEEKERAEREAREAEERAQKAEEARLEAIAQAERDRKAAAEKAEQDRLDAIATERKRAGAQLAAEEAEVARLAAVAVQEAEQRAADKTHRRAVNGNALSAMQDAIAEHHRGSHADSEAICKAIIAAIAQGKIPNVSINY